MEILAQSSTAFVLTHNFQGTHILGASRGRLSDSVASCSLWCGFGVGVMDELGVTIAEAYMTANIKCT